MAAWWYFLTLRMTLTATNSCVSLSQHSSTRPKVPARGQGHATSAARAARAARGERARGRAAQRADVARDAPLQRYGATQCGRRAACASQRARASRCGADTQRQSALCGGAARREAGVPCMAGRGAHPPQAWLGFCLRGGAGHASAGGLGWRPGRAARGLRGSSSRLPSCVCFALAPAAGHAQRVWSMLSPSSYCMCPSCGRGGRVSRPASEAA
jgi:hypothetical protein